jgi:alpha-D-ribose 1-methylphosphonate 5-triphosphate diphosphatase
MTTLVLENATLVLPDRVVEHGWLAASDGVIVEIGEGRPPESGLDCGGDTVLPGLVELHTDHLESHYSPRPKVRWNPLAAVMAYDAQIASAGITTVFDSLRAGTDADSASLGDDLLVLADAVETARLAGVLRVEHRTHLRCDLSSEDVLDQTEAFAAERPIHLISLMDHTPGQRQFTSVAAWKAFYQRRGAKTEAELDRFIELRTAARDRYADVHRRRLVQLAAERGTVLASHDDADEGHVAESAADGVRIAEFPTTMAAARASRAAGVAVMMGAPNVIRGGSHSGNVAAADLAREGLLDILSSDYVPASLLMAALDLPHRAPGITLPQAVATVTVNPARAVGLDDRGALAPGLRADLVRVARLGDAPFAREVYRAGRRIA